MEQRDWPGQMKLWARAGALRLQAIPRAWLLAGMTALLVGIGLLLVQSAMAQRAAAGPLFNLALPIALLHRALLAWRWTQAKEACGQAWTSRPARLAARERIGNHAAMAILSDKWIRTQALEHGMIEPFVEAQRRDGCIDRKSVV